jgi:hypothetical protein
MMKGEAMSLAIDDSTKKKIDDWIQKSGRNQFGDPADTVYAGGNPLFDERNPKMKDRYEYILEKHPELKGIK